MFLQYPAQFDNILQWQFICCMHIYYILIPDWNISLKDRDPIFPVQQYISSA